MENEYDFSEAERLLLKWSRFAKGHQGGWPANSITGAMMDQYEVGIRSDPDFAVSHIPEDVAMVDAIIAKMPGTTKRVMMVYWLNSRAPREVHGAMLKVSGRHFERLHKAAMLVFVARLAQTRLAA